MQRKLSLQQLQRIADAKSDIALAQLAQVNAQINNLMSERRALEARFSQASHATMTSIEVFALDKYRDWVKNRCAHLDLECARLQEKAAQLKELARLDFGKAQAIRKLRRQ